MKALCATCGKEWRPYHGPVQAWWRCEDCTTAESKAVIEASRGMTAEYVTNSLFGKPRWIVTHTDGRVELCQGVEAWGANAGKYPGIHPTYRIPHPDGGWFCLSPAAQTELEL